MFFCPRACEEKQENKKFDFLKGGFLKSGFKGIVKRW
jgi:hypothetical protein